MINTTSIPNYLAFVGCPLNGTHDMPNFNGIVTFPTIALLTMLDVNGSPSLSRK
jgi:hypothetical protein